MSKYVLWFSDFLLLYPYYETIFFFFFFFLVDYFFSIQFVSGKNAFFLFFFRTLIGCPCPHLSKKRIPSFESTFLLQLTFLPTFAYAKINKIVSFFFLNRNIAFFWKYIVLVMYQRIPFFICHSISNFFFLCYFNENIFHNIVISKTTTKINTNR